MLHCGDLVRDPESGSMQHPIPCLLLVLLPAFLSSSTHADLREAQVRIRDFTVSHPDFRSRGGIDTGFVASRLGPDRKPVYTGPSGGTATTAGPEFFGQWFNDVPGVNVSTTKTLTFEDAGGMYEFQAPSFFPIDGELFGNEGLDHNYLFTLELHSYFQYMPGMSLTFSGCDDLFLFINRELVLDLGGVHDGLSGSIDLDTLNLLAGHSYDFDLFYAGRKTDLSSFKITTSIALNSGCTTPAFWSNYGLGSPGANGSPTIRASSAPVLGASFDILMGNADNFPAHACIYFGTAPAAISTPFGIMLVDFTRLVLIEPVLLAPYPQETPMSFAPRVGLCGVPLYGQVAHFDSTSGVAISEGIVLVPGI